jgi:predicted DNA-binding transcriptional regulator AlpA
MLQLLADSMSDQANGQVDWLPVCVLDSIVVALRRLGWRCFLLQVGGSGEYSFVHNQPAKARQIAMTQHQTASPRLIDMKTALKMIPVSKSQWFDMVAKGKAPRQVKLLGRSFWLLDEVQAMIDQAALARVE